MRARWRMAIACASPSRRRRRRRRRSLPLRAGHGRPRPAPVRRGHATGAPATCSDRARRRIDGVAGVVLRGVGAERARVSAWSATSTRGTAAHPRDAAARAQRRLGAVRARASGRARPTSTRSGRRYGRADPQGGSLRAATSRCRRRRRRSCGTAPAYAGATHGVDASARQAAGSWFERPMSIYEVHLGSWMRRRRRHGRSSPTASWPRRWCRT